MDHRRARPPLVRITTVVPTLFVLTLFTSILIFMGMGNAPTPAVNAPQPVPAADKDKPPTANVLPTPATSAGLAGETHAQYSVLTGYFQTSETATDDDAFNYTTSNFGLLDRKYDTDSEFDPDGKKTQWQRFEYHLSSLNKKSDGNTGVKLFLFGRHGQGFHNVAEAQFGTKLWDCYWSMQERYKFLMWSDAHLTLDGEIDAGHAQDAFLDAITNPKVLMPAPQSYYVSPLWRCLETAYITFAVIQKSLPADRPFKPIIKELFRETIGAHTCDRRSRRTELHPLWEDGRQYRFEEGFAEEDEFWKPKLRETDLGTDARLAKALDEVWIGDKNEWISVTAHSGSIASVLRVVGHRKFALKTGGVIPVLMKMTKVAGKRPTSDAPTYTEVVTCPKPTPS